MTGTGLVDGKGDSPPACGSACSTALCGWDCSAPAQQCSPACAEDRGADAFVAVSATRSSINWSFDSRTTPYVPDRVFSPALVYGCKLWSFADDRGQVLAVEYVEYHTRSRFDSDVVIGNQFEASFENIAGPGSYSGSAIYGTEFGQLDYGQHSCTADIAPHDGGLMGTISCTMVATQATVTFDCPGNALAKFQDVQWPPAPPQ